MTTFPFAWRLSCNLKALQTPSVVKGKRCCEFVQGTSLPSPASLSALDRLVLLDGSAIAIEYFGSRLREKVLVRIARLIAGKAKIFKICHIVCAKITGKQPFECKNKSVE